MARATANLQGRKTWAKYKGESPYPSNAQSKERMGCKERKPKVPCIIHATRVKRIPERVTESNKLGGNGKRVKARKVLGSNGSGTCTQGLGVTSQLVKKKKRSKDQIFFSSHVPHLTPFPTTHFHSSLYHFGQFTPFPSFLFFHFLSYTHLYHSHPLHQYFHTTTTTISTIIFLTRSPKNS